MLPLRLQSEAAFRDHLLLTCIPAVFYNLIQDRVQPTALAPQSLFLDLQNHKDTVYDRGNTSGAV